MADKKQSLLPTKHLWEFRSCCVSESRQSCLSRVNLLLVTSLLPVKGSACCCLQYTFWDRNAFFPKCQPTLHVPFMDNYTPSLLSYPTRHLKYYLVIYFLGHTSKQVYRLQIYIYMEIYSIPSFNWIQFEMHKTWKLWKLGFIKA